MEGQAALRELQADPNNTAARARYAQALSEQGACQLALDQLSLLRRNPDSWSSRLATFEGGCWLRLGQLSLAEAALSEALLLDDENAIARLRLAEVALHRGDLDAFEAIFADQLDSEGYTRVAQMFELEHSLMTGVGDLQVDSLLFRQDASDRGAPRAVKVGHIYDSRGWLRDNRPSAASEVLGEVLSQNVTMWQASLYRLEAYRRLGQPEKALTILERPLIQRIDWSLKSAYAARVLTDLGRYAEAESVLAGLDGSELLDVEASRWYLAQVRGDVTAAGYHAARWQDHPLSPSLYLEHLLPVDSGASP
jgi:tetratricopeptide (TPR) repeat protein